MKMRHTVALAVLTLCAAVQLVAAQNVAAAKLQELVVAYAAAEPNSDLTVVLRNNLADSTIVIQPILRDGNGNETQGKPLTLRSREVRHVPLPALFGGLSDDSGQLLLRFASADADNVAASIVFRRGRREVQPQAAGVDSAKLDKKSESHVVWYLPKPTAHVGLVFTNTGGDAAFAVIDGGAPITVSPKATVQVPVPQTTGDSGSTVIVAPPKMQVTTVATGGAIASNFSRLQPPMSAITQRRAKPNPTATLRSGPIAPGACTADHGYSVLLHNMSATAVTGRAVLKEYSNGIGMAVGLLPISIAPGDTLLAEFRPPQSTTPESWHAVDVEYVGSAGNLVGMALAHRQAGVEVQPVSASASKHYVGTRWESALGASTGIRVVNAGRTPAEYAITFYAPDSSVLYRIKAPTLNPGQDALVDIGQLRDQAVPDTEGRQMPLTLEEGTFEVETADGNMDGLVFAAATNVSSDSTVTATPLGGFCCGSSSAGIQPNPVLVEWLTWNYAAWYRRDECTAVTRKASALSWWTDDAWIAEVDSIGGVHGLRAGTTNVDAEVELWLGGPFGCGDHWYETVYAPVYSYTPVQHNYPGNPLGQACRISQFFDRIGHSGSSHHAEDVVFDGVATSWGAPVYAMEAGTVTKVVATAGPASLPFPQCQGAGAPGNRVNVQAADGYITVYYHVMPLTGITVNTHVSQGQQIGNLDNSGCQSGPHLHVGRIDTASNPVNFTIPCVNPLPTNGFGDGSVDDDDVDIP